MRKYGITVFIVLALGWALTYPAWGQGQMQTVSPGTSKTIHAQPGAKVTINVPSEMAQGTQVTVTPGTAPGGGTEVTVSTPAAPGTMGAAGTMPRYSFDQKHEFTQAVQSRLEQIDRQADRVQDKTSREYMELRRKEEVARDRLRGMQAASREEWERAQARMHSALNDMEMSLRQLQ